MSPAETLMNKAVTEHVPSDDWRPTKAYKVHILITKDDEGTYSAVALNLPGAGSCGETEEEAVENAKEAVLGVVESYLEAGEEIPWKDTSNIEIPFGAEQKWIVVHA
jgi:predicted RNase H-like HicB family nuclease